jgi:predicted nucleic acid-binding protein
VIVLDASAVVELVLNSARGADIESWLKRRPHTWHSVHLLDVEFIQTLRRLHLAGTISADRAETALHDLARLPVVRHPHQPVASRIWQLRANLSAYDACYVALAEVLRARLLTTDGRLARSSGHTAIIELF